MNSLDFFIKKFDNKSFNYFNLKNPKIFNQLRSLGVLISFSDSVSYRGESFLFVGGANSGKTYISNRLKKIKGFSKTSEDCTLMKIQEENILIPRSSLTYKVNFQDLERESFPLKEIFYFNNLNERKRSKLYVLSKMFGGKKEVVKNNPLEKIFSNVSVINIPYSNKPKEKYFLVKNKIIMVEG